MKNNFKKLEEDLISQYGEPPSKIKANIDGTFDIFRACGDIVELFIPKMLDLLLSLFGAQSDNSSSNKKSQ